MSWTKDIIDSVASTYQYAATKFRTPRKTPRWISAEVGGEGYDFSEFWSNMSNEQRQKAAMTLSWIYGNVIRISNEVAAAEYQVYKKNTQERDIEHPLENLIKFPNEFFDGQTLWRYTIWALSLDKNGAFWFLSPDRNTGQLSEIWPIPINRLTPVKHESKFISHYIYKSNNKKIPIRPEFICRFVYAHPDDLWGSLTPLEASERAMSIYEGVSTAQRDLFTQSRGTPLSILSLDPNISDPDFAVARDQIRNDWEEERKVAIVRGGTLDVESVGLSNRDLEVISTQEFTRDEIDSIFMGGIEWRSRAGSATDRAEINKEIKEVVIRPLHVLLANRIQLHIINNFYGNEFIGEFEDVRAQDRSIKVQEANAYWKVLKVNQALAELGKPPFENEELPGYGDLPVPLAMNPSFILKWYGKGEMKDSGELPPEIGNLDESQDPEMLTNQLAEGKSIDVSKAIVDGVYHELKNYKKVLLRTWRKHETPESLVGRAFDTDIIYPEIMEEIGTKLPFVKSESDIHNIFDEWLT